MIEWNDGRGKGVEGCGREEKRRRPKWRGNKTARPRDLPS